MSELTVVSEEEMNNCPDCGEHLSHETPEFLGEGVMVVRVKCSDCDWWATEEWVHDQTVKDD